MKRIFLLLISAVLVSADAPAARMSLLDLIGSGSRKAPRSRHKTTMSSHNATNVAPDSASSPLTASKATDPTNDVETASATATNAVPRIDTDVAPEVSTNVVAGVATNVMAQAMTNMTRKLPPKRAERPARISSNKVYYDRKEGYAVFTGKVHVDSEEYQMHANKAYVFFEGTNELKRVVASGSVAITNDTKRAYGAKASYYRKTGMVVLYGDDKTVAEVRDESKNEDQVVKGSKIKFWIDSEQVEVIDARISAPMSGGIGDLKDSLMSK